MMTKKNDVDDNRNTNCNNSNNNSSNNSGKPTPLANNNQLTNNLNIARQLLTVIQNDDFDELITILRSKPDLNVFINGQTALHYCLLLGRDVSWCQQLIQSGANPNLSNHDGWQPLHLAAFNGLQESLTYLITCNNKSIANEIM